MPSREVMLELPFLSVSRYFAQLLSGEKIADERVRQPGV